MKTVTFECLRWLEHQARITISLQNGLPQVYFQVTAPREVAKICRGRPVEELPRLLAMFSPSHHLASALALDQLFGVEPPDLARNMREGLRQAFFFRHHLRKIYFLLSSWENPFVDFWSPESRRGPHRFAHHLLDDLMHHVSLGQEAGAILGGRADHPLTAVAGGVSRFLKDDHYPRLAGIADSCRKFAVRLGEFFREEVFAWGKLEGLQDLGVAPLASLAMGPEADSLVLRDPHAKELERFSPAAVFEKVALHREPWTYEPFAYLKDRGWQDLGAEPADSLFFVGPLARLNSGEALPTPLAEEERQRLISFLGLLPRFEVAAAYWAILVEMLEAAENMVELYDTEKLTGPALRAIPADLGREGHAALESPLGLIYQHYQVDDRGLVQDIQFLDPATANNALRCLLVKKAVEVSLVQNKSWEETKKRIELSLLPF